MTTAQGALRHSDAGVTLRCYTKVVADDVRIAMGKLGDALDMPDVARENGLQDTLGTLKQVPGTPPEFVN